jgi:hypothetical protein
MVLLVDPPGGSAAAAQTMRDLRFTHVVDGWWRAERAREAGAPVSPDRARHGSRSCRSGLSRQQ